MWVGGFQYVLGLRGDQQLNSRHSHAWLEGQSLIVDITADQFQEFPHKVFVGASSDFHSTFEVEERFDADFRIYDCHTVSELARAYSEVMKHYALAFSQKLPK